MEGRQLRILVRQLFSVVSVMPLLFLKLTTHLYSCFGLIVSVVDRILVMRTLLYSNLNRKSSSIHTHKVSMFVNRKKKEKMPCHHP